MKIKNKLVPLMLSTIAVSTGVSAVEFHGYFRSGVGASDNGSQQCAYNDKFGRLGNECETYGEIDLQQELYNKDGKSFKVESMWAIVTDQNNDWEPLGDGGDGAAQGTISLRQFNVQAKGVLGFAPEAVLWAGKRFYQRHDVHHIDFFYWDISGAGAGIEKIKAGPGEVSLAWVRQDTGDDASAASNGNVFDFRYAGIPLGDSSLELGLTYRFENLTDDESDSNLPDDSSILLTGELTTPLLNGFNKLVLQYGDEGYALEMTRNSGGKGVSSVGEGNSGFRILDHGLIKPVSNIELAYSIYYASSDDEANNGDVDILSVVARPAFIMSENFRTYLELGYFSGEQNGADIGGSKVTGAVAWSAGTSYWARPEIRVFASLLNDSETDSFRGEDQVINFGVQAEAWW